MAVRRIGLTRMEFRHLKYFIAVAEEGSFTRAARRLWMAQPGLSVQIKQLETELGTPLFTRHSRGAELTPAGELFLDRARLVLREVRASASSGAEGPWPAATVRVGLCTAAPWPGTRDMLAGIDIEEADLEIDLIEGCGGALWTELRDRGLDVLIGPDYLSSPDLQAVALGSAPWGIMLDEKHRLAAVDGPIAAAELSGEIVLVNGRRDGAAYDRAVHALLEGRSVRASSAAAPPGQVPADAVVGNSAVAVTTDPILRPRRARWRELTPRESLGFVALWIDSTPQPALARFLARLDPRVDLSTRATPVG